MNMLKNAEPLRVLNAVAAGTTSQDCTAVDCSDCEGVLFIAAFGALTTNAVTGLKAAQSSDAGSSDAYSDLEGSLCSVADDQDNKIVVLDIYRPTKKDVRATVVRGTANAVIDGVIAIKYGMRKSPPTLGSTVVATSKTKVSPAEGTA